MKSLGNMNTRQPARKIYLTYETESVTLGTVLAEITAWNTVGLITGRCKFQASDLEADQRVGLSDHPGKLRGLWLRGLFDTLNSHRGPGLYPTWPGPRGLIYSELNTRDQDYQSDTYDWRLILPIRQG
jgi:hypothetical protein